MKEVDSRDLISGTVIGVTGIFTVIYCLNSYEVGTIAYMGPGMFPLMLGVILTFLGGLIAIPAMFHVGTIERPAVRPLVAIMLAVIAFAMTVESLGLLPAVFITTVVATRADRAINVRQALGLALVLALIIVGIFKIGLSLPVSVVTGLL